MCTKNRDVYSKLGGDMKCLRFSSKAAIAGMFLIPIFISAPLFALTLMVTVKQGEQQQFHGLGCSMFPTKELLTIPPERARALANLLWGSPGTGGANFQYVRLCEASDSTGPLTVASYKGLYNDIKAVNSNAKFLYSPNGNPSSDPAGYAKHYAQILKMCADSGMPFDATGLHNDPASGANGFDSTMAASLVKYFRAALDSQGLQSVKIIAPDISAVDSIQLGWTRNIISDQGALSKVDGFGAHSYVMSFSPQYDSLIRSTGKESWQTESGDTGFEFEYMNGGDINRALQLSARVCNDLNFGSNVWMHHIGYMPPDSADKNASRILYFDSTGSPTFLTKYYYYNFFGRIFKPGCFIRRCVNDYPGNTSFQNMVLTYGNRPYFNAAAAKNPDGSWVLNVVNTTNLTHDQEKYFPSATISIWWHVEELADSGIVHFTRYQSDMFRAGQNMASQTMVNGDILINIGAMNMVTLVSDRLPPEGVIDRGSAKGAMYNVAYNSATRQLSFTVAGSSYGQLPVFCAAYNLEGKKISTLVNGKLQAGTHTISLTGKNRLAPGVYLLNLKIGTEQHSVKIAM
jgi:hypothetical protein